MLTPLLLGALALVLASPVPRALARTDRLRHTPVPAVLLWQSTALARPGPAELAAVVAHERSHLRARHDLVLEAFTVLHRAFPRGVSSGAAHHEVQVLVGPR